MMSGEFSEEYPFQVKNRLGVVLLDAAEYGWSLIFENSWFQEQPDGSAIETFEPRVLVHLADIEEAIGEPLTQQHIIHVRGKDYPISDVQPDGHGMAYVPLRKPL